LAIVTDVLRNETNAEIVRIIHELGGRAVDHDRSRIGPDGGSWPRGNSGPRLQTAH
jgi:hypothetical protein